MKRQQEKLRKTVRNKETVRMRIETGYTKKKFPASFDGEKKSQNFTEKKLTEFPGENGNNKIEIV